MHVLIIYNYCRTPTSDDTDGDDSLKPHKPTSPSIIGPAKHTTKGLLSFF